MQIAAYKCTMDAIQSTRRALEDLEGRLSRVKAYLDDKGDIVAVVDGPSVTFRDTEVSFDLLRRVYHGMLPEDAPEAPTEKPPAEVERVAAYDDGPISDLLFAREDDDPISDLRFAREWAAEWVQPGRKLRFSDPSGDPSQQYTIPITSGWTERQKVSRLAQNQKVTRVTVLIGGAVLASAKFGGKKKA